MKKNIKSIQGQQVIPNPVGPECIRVTKIYDWVVLTGRERTNLTIPDECLARINEARAEGNLITATCSEIKKSRCCDLISSVPADIGVPGAQIVTLSFHVQIKVQFFSNGVAIPGCKFVAPVNMFEDVILCYPEGTDINCSIYEVKCNVLLNRLAGNVVVLDVVICPSVSVEAKVALEVEARFCGPRDILPIPEPDKLHCEFPGFPPQCPSLFPPAGTAVQGAAEYSGPVTLVYSDQGLPTTPTGELDFLALVADQCNLDDSKIKVNFFDTVGPTPTGTPDDDSDQSFSFMATEFNQPVAVGANGLTVTGNGKFRPAGGVYENATFTLTLTDSDPNSDTATLQITTATSTVLIQLNELANPGLEVEVAPCNGF